MKNGDMNVAIVGLGKQGKVHFNALVDLQQEKKLKIISICEKDETVLNNFSQKGKTEGFVNFQEMVTKYGKEIDLLIAALPNDTYHKIILGSVDYDFIILKEKPYATSKEEVVSFNNICQKSNTKIHTAQQRFFSNSFISAKEWIAGDLLGRVLFFDYSYSINDKSESWYWDHEAGGGCWLNVGWHMIFVVNWFFGKPQKFTVNKVKIQKRAWEYETDDTVLFSCSYNHGLTGKGFISVVDINKEKVIKIVGDRGYAEIRKSKAVLYNNEDKIVNEVEDDSDIDIYKRQIMAILKGDDKVSELENYNMQTMQVINSQ